MRIIHRDIVEYHGIGDDLGRKLISQCKMYLISLKIFFFYNDYDLFSAYSVPGRGRPSALRIFLFHPHDNPVSHAVDTSGIPIFS